MSAPWNAVGRYGTAGLELVVTIGLLTWAGHWLDVRFGFGGWGLGVGFVVGAAVAFRNLLRTAKSMERDIERDEARNPGSSRWNVDSNWVHKEGDDPNWVFREGHDPNWVHKRNEDEDADADEPSGPPSPGGKS
jgi:hypothetical protein